MTRIDVVDFDDDDEPLTIDAERVGDLASVLYMPVPRWLAPSEVDRRANRLPAPWRTFPELVVCRVHPAQYEGFCSDPSVREDLVARFDGIPVVVLSWDQEFVWTSISGEDLDASARERLCEALAHAELRALLERSGVILPSTDGYHYEGPNGRHYETFVRVGTAIQQVEALNSIAFWLLPSLARSPIIVLESWTIVSLGLNAAQYLLDNNIRDPAGGPARVRAVETRKSYSEPSQRLLQRLVGLRERDRSFTAAPPVLALISVSSTGTTARELVDTCRRAGHEQVELLALYRSGAHTEPRTLCTLTEVSQHWPPGADDCPHCARGSQTVKVLPDTYLLDIAATVKSDAAIRMTDVQFARRFLTKYAGSGSIRVHRHQHDDQRHHMIYVDVQPLIGHPRFIEGVARELEDLSDDIDLIVCPQHDAACALAAVVAEHLGLPVLQADPRRLLDLDGAERDLLDGARRVLMVDDVVITGTRIRQYRNMLHREGVAIHPDFELHVLAGIARPSSLTRLKGVMDFAHFEERFHFVELLPLPHWKGDDCPWCQEHELLRRHGAAAPESEALRERFNRIRDTVEGLTTHLFLPWLADPERVTDPMLLGPHSIFLAETEAELFAAVASSLQVLRNAGVLNERFTLPVAKVLSHDFAFNGRFYDTVITACLLRATRRHDLRAPTIDADLTALAMERLQEDATVALHGEILFALYREHFPGGLSLATRSGALEQDGADVGVQRVMRDALGPADPPVGSY